MGRPVNRRWLNVEGTANATLSGETAGNEKIFGVCKIGANAAAEYTILEQKGSNKFYVRDTAGNTGICTLVNKPERAGNQDTNPALAADEMIMNCKDDQNDIHRVMKLMNRTLIYQADSSTTNVRAMWGFAAAAAAAGSDPGSIKTVQLEELEIAGSGSEFKTDS
tara:strand:+ start:2842 stop:3336 length:495 start_codon:yes stop_codon:yes gene_type:complete